MSQHFTFSSVPQFFFGGAVNFGNIPAGSTADVTVPMAGLTKDMTPVVSPLAPMEDGLVIGQACVSANGTLKVRFFNRTAADIDLASAQWKVIGL